MQRDFVRVSPEALVPTDWNPRKIKPQNRLRLKRILLENGYVGGVVAWRGPMGMELVGGHQRLGVIRECIADTENGGSFEFGSKVYDRDALKELGFLILNVCVLSECSREEAAALCVALNNQDAQGEYDQKLLTDLVSTLDANGFDATLTGFDEVLLASMLTSVPAMPAAAAPLPSVPDAATALQKQEPRLPGEKLVEIYCSADVLESIMLFLQELAEREGVRVTIT